MYFMSVKAVHLKCSCRAMFRFRFAIRSPSFPFPIRVWDYPNKRCTGRGIFGSVATLPMLATISLFLLLR